MTENKIKRNINPKIAELLNKRPQFGGGMAKSAFNKPTKAMNKFRTQNRGGN